MKAHKELVEYAKTVLQKEGFKDDEIFTEFVVYAPNYPRKQFYHGNYFYKIDVAGISMNKLWAIECGCTHNFRSAKIRELEEIFDKVLVIPYPHALEILNLSK